MIAKPASGSSMYRPADLSAAQVGRLPDAPTNEILRGGAVALLFFAGLAGWSAIVPLEAAVVAQGVVAVSGNRQAVQHLDGGIVGALHVKEGDQVQAGQILIELEDTQIASQERALSARLIELESQRARIIAEDAGADVIEPPARWAGLAEDDRAIAGAVLDRQNRELAARLGSESSRVAVLHQQRLELEARLPGFQLEMDASAEQIRLLDDEIAGLRTLKERGLATVGKLRSLERERANLEGRIGRLASDMSQTREGIAQTRGEIASLSAGLGVDRAKELREVEAQIAEAQPQYAALVAKLERTRIRAPASGEIVGLTAFTVGGVIEPGGHVMDVVPIGRDLVIEASIAPESGDDIQLASHAEIRLPGFAGGDIPKLHGTVSKVSADRIVDPKSGVPFFRVEVAVPATELEKLAEARAAAATQLRPGIPAEVIMPIRQRSALQYFLEPLASAIWSSFREN